MAEIQIPKADTVFKHITHVPHARKVKPIDIKGFKAVAMGKHSAHIRDFRSVKTADIQLGETLSPRKHTAHIVDLHCVETTHIQILKTAATVKHTVHFLRLRSVEAAQVEGGQALAGVEHTVHFPHLFRVKTADIEAFQGGTVVKHTMHCFDGGGIHTGKVKAGQGGAVGEHPTHVFNAFGIKQAVQGDFLRLGVAVKNMFAVIDNTFTLATDKKAVKPVLRRSDPSHDAAVPPLGDVPSALPDLQVAVRADKGDRLYALPFVLGAENVLYMFRVVIKSAVNHTRRSEQPPDLRAEKGKRGYDDQQ